MSAVKATCPTCGAAATGWHRDRIENLDEYGLPVERTFKPGPTFLDPCGHLLVGEMRYTVSS